MQWSALGVEQGSPEVRTGQGAAALAAGSRCPGQVGAEVVFAMTAPCPSCSRAAAPRAGQSPWPCGAALNRAGTELKCERAVCRCVSCFQTVIFCAGSIPRCCTCPYPGLCWEWCWVAWACHLVSQPLSTQLWPQTSLIPPVSRWLLPDGDQEEAVCTGCNSARNFHLWGAPSWEICGISHTQYF